MTQIANSLAVLNSFSDATSALIKITSHSMASAKAQMPLGKGAVLTKDGYIVTSNHVLAGKQD